MNEKSPKTLKQSDPGAAARTAIVPDWLSILSGRQPNENFASLAYRPEGTNDWLLVATTGGHGLVRSARGAERLLQRGDLLLFRPGARQDYGFSTDSATWHNTWVHFRPRPAWLDWLAWPEFDKGVFILGVQENFDAIAPELDRLHEVANGPTRLRIESAMNALEKVLILADGSNPRFGGADVDQRIHRALVLIGERIAEPMSVAALAAEVGVSRSQFSVLFTRQMKVSPQVYIETMKLDRAAQMLRHAHWTVSQVSAVHGFASVFYFSTRFRKHFGMSPTEYRQRNRDTDGWAVGASPPDPGQSRPTKEQEPTA